MTLYQKGVSTLAGKVAIVTGAGQGLGRGIATGLGGQGARIVVADLNLHTAEDVAASLKAQNIDALAVEADVSVSSQVENMVSATLRKFERIDILVNNAGRNRRAPITEMTEEAWDSVVATNLRSVFLCGQAVAKQMIKQGGGKVVNIASVAAHGAVPGLAAYCATKGGIVSLTRVMAIEWAKYNINVNSVSPGLIQKETGKENGELSAKYEQRARRIPLGRDAKIQDVVNLVVFLVGPESDYITGRDMVIDGGLFAFHPGFAGTS